MNPTPTTNRPRHRLPSGGLTLALLLAAILAGRPARAFEDDIDDIDEPPPRKAPVKMSDDKYFDRLVFGVDQDTNKFRNQLKDAFDRRLEIVGRTCKLTREQRSKLYLAGQGDIKRLVDRVEAKRARFLEVKGNPVELNQFIRELATIRTAIRADGFSDNLIFIKTLKSTLTPEQLIAYEKAEREDWLDRHHQSITLILNAESRRLKLDPQQKQKFAELLEEGIRPIKPVGAWEPSVELHIMYSLAQLPEDQLRTIFSEDQWGSYSRRMESFRSRYQSQAKNQTPTLKTAPRESNGR